MFLDQVIHFGKNLAAACLVEGLPEDSHGPCVKERPGRHVGSIRCNCCPCFPGDCHAVSCSVFDVFRPERVAGPPQNPKMRGRVAKSRPRAILHRVWMDFGVHLGTLGGVLWGLFWTLSDA